MFFKPNFVNEPLNEHFRRAEITSAAFLFDKYTYMLNIDIYSWQKVKVFKISWFSQGIWSDAN